jgi:hypothetical protein
MDFAINNRTSDSLTHENLQKIITAIDIPASPLIVVATLAG